MGLDDIRLGFACKERWEDMVGDDRVRDCRGCDRQVFNLSAMTRAEAEALLAARGVTPCVRFYRRPDGTVMTSDCPTSLRRGGRRLAMFAAAGSALAAAPVAFADPEPSSTLDDGSAAGSGSDEAPEKIEIDQFQINQGLPALPRTDTWEVGVIVLPAQLAPRPAVEWSLWARLGVGIAPERADLAARRVIAPAPEPGIASMSEAALGAELTFRVARHGDLRAGAWGEARTTSDPVAGAELVLEGLPPHPYNSRIGGTGSLVLRAGGNAHVVTGALGFGYVGSWAYDGWLRHVVGARVVVSANRSLDDPHAWSATLGLEVDPIGAVHAVYDLVTRR